MQLNKKKAPLQIIWSSLLLLVFVFTSCNDKIIKNKKDAPISLELPISSRKVGLGLIHFNVNKSIPLFKKENDTIPYDTLQFIKKKTGPDKGICVFKTNILGERLKPYSLSGGDSDEVGREHLNMGLIRFVPELVFRVIEKNEHGIVVLINEETNETNFIKIDTKNDLNRNTNNNLNYFDPNFIDSPILNWYYYETWEQLIKRAFGIGIDHNEMVFDKPNGNIITIDNSDYFKVDSLQNNWARLTNRDYYTESEKKIFGWVKWKESDRIKIHITLHGGYE